ncbi:MULTISPECIES: NAD(P)/FAD-dependent oxidoreductase [unclassified Streptomyces]|uniref:NAD(P)/FAD-dependent oxidoreductase n=1 Tax=unclassified Streptomyces TaxID=2593676 RepID=UPI00226F21FB|nr:MULTISPECIES: FAD-binding oxidoreductase [unclassified Streptomyces]MCY0920565.1 FAD-binding oxidoreductase [Streptomyces sp. H27-G5]MCY0957298.1 FAD-binding oxidoreductase [Streptomyces sp. H27-H5]
MNGSGTPWASGEDTAPRPRLHGRRRCDVAVVGAGLTGLSTAVELLELDPDLRVVVVEADHVAAGASGRGTGLLGPRVGPPLRVARRRYGDDVARAAHLWSIAAVRHVLDLVRRHEIACDLTPGSQLVVARDEKAAEEQWREADAAGALGLPVALVERDELPAVAARHLGGLRYGEAATLDPAALTGQLARIGEQRGLTVFERSPVRAVRRGLLTTLATDDGEIVADHVVTAVNAYGAAPGAPAGVVGLRVQAGVTRKLPPEALSALDGLHTEPLIEHGELSPYFRLTLDGRLVVGGGAVRRGPFGSVAPAPGRLRAAVRSLSPTLADVEIESSWAGPIAMTRDGLPIVGRHRDDPGLLHAGGCNGHGLAVSAYNGAQLARRIVEGAGDDLPFALPWVRSKGPWVPRGRLADRVLDRYLAHLGAEAGRSSAPGPGPSAAPAGRSSHARRTEST